MRNDNGSSEGERRIAFLERVYLDDHRRWEKNQRTLDAHLKRLEAMEKRLDRHMDQSDRRWVRALERMRKSDGRHAKAEERYAKTGARIEAALRVLHRLMERRPGS
ncbi:MAG: hypothetical protein HYZ53_16360 [Planctomycetes bacterium]|nr:hypothetical protein [Planctomycetota bacterium]